VRINLAREPLNAQRKGCAHDIRLADQSEVKRAL
jgi:hypothetical protein